MRARSIRRRFLVAALLAGVAAVMGGCALNPPPTSQELQREVLTHTTLPPAFRAGDGTAAPVADRWLAAFDEPALAALVVEALAYNTDLRVSAARVEQAAGDGRVANA